MLDPTLGRFDYVVAMDSLIHYDGRDIARIVAGLAVRTQSSILFTIAPRTPALSLMHAVGRFFPRSDRAPAIAPISRSALERHFDAHPDLRSWRIVRTNRVDSGFYVSQALEATHS